MLLIQEDFAGGERQARDEAGRRLADPSPSVEAATSELDETASIVGLGPLVCPFGCSGAARRRWLFAGPVLVVVSLVAFGISCAALGFDARLLVPWLGAAAGAYGTFRFIALLAVRGQLHERGLVLRRLDGVRAIHWEAIACLRGPSPGPLTLDLAHGESLALPADIEDLPALREVIEESTLSRLWAETRAAVHRGETAQLGHVGLRKDGLVIAGSLHRFREIESAEVQGGSLIVTLRGYLTRRVDIAVKRIPNLHVLLEGIARLHEADLAASVAKQVRAVRRAG